MGLDVVRQLRLALKLPETLRVDADEPLGRVRNFGLRGNRQLANRVGYKRHFLLRSSLTYGRFLRQRQRFGLGKRVLDGDGRALLERACVGTRAGRQG